MYRRSSKFLSKKCMASSLMFLNRMNSSSFRHFLEEKCSGADVAGREARDVSSTSRPVTKRTLFTINQKFVRLLGMRCGGLRL